MDEDEEEEEQHAQADEEERQFWHIVAGLVADLSHNKCEDLAASCLPHAAALAKVPRTNFSCFRDADTHRSIV